MIPRDLIDRAKTDATKTTGVPVERMLVSATHTHSAPAATPLFQSDPDPEYQKFLARRIADGVWRAANNLAPAKIGWGSAQVPEHVFNRRWFMKPGTVLRDPFNTTNDRVKMNPGVANADLLEPAGPTDPEVVFISLQHTNGKPLALLANYSLHYCGGVGQGVISADYFGMFADRIQHLLAGLGADRQDPPFVGAMANGTSGNINNINFRGGQSRLAGFGQMRLVAHSVAEAVNREHQKLQFRDWVPLKSLQTELTLRVRKPASREADTAESVLSTKTARLLTPEEVYARETVLLKDYPDEVTLILQALRIGDVGVAAIPCEVFVEIGLDLKRESPFKPSFTISLANGYNGYLPTTEHFKLGGYETWRARSSYLETNAAPRIYKTVLDLMKQLR